MRTLAILPFLLLLAGCSGTSEKQAATPKSVPDTYRVKFSTSKGDFVVEVTKAWAPDGATRFFRLVEQKFFDRAIFFRVVRGFIVQFGINADPQVHARWRNLTMSDDPAKESNRRGTITFATSGPNTRTTQVFINLKDNKFLDEAGFVPFGRVTEGMEQVLDRLYSSYGDGPPNGTGPDQGEIEKLGNAYLDNKYPRLDWIKTASFSQ